MAASLSSILVLAADKKKVNLKASQYTSHQLSSLSRNKNGRITLVTFKLLVTHISSLTRMIRFNYVRSLGLELNDPNLTGMTTYSTTHTNPKIYCVLHWQGTGDKTTVNIHYFILTIVTTQHRFDTAYTRFLNK